MQQRPNLCTLNSQEGEGDRGCEGHTDNLLITLVLHTLVFTEQRVVVFIPLAIFFFFI